MNLIRRALVILSSTSCLLLVQAAQAAAISTEDKAPEKAQPAARAPQGKSPFANDVAPDPSLMLDAALRQGLWRKACSIATNTLAREERNLDALGVFSVCAALRNDKDAAGTALLRLRETEVAPNYYATMTEGILQLRNNSADRAEATFKGVLRSRPDDPLALYFQGEALHALKRDAEAVTAFKSVLKRWPDHAPALAGAAQLMAAPKASKEDLKQAVAMTERAAKIEPMNLAYWKQLADLCDRVGERDRAAAIRLQWLSPPSVKK